MTEKRFNVFDVDGTVFIEDHKEGSYHIGEKENVDIHCLNDIADRLNTYADENEQLKSDNKCYVKRYSELFEDYIACKKENEQLKKQRYDLYSDIARLVEENEQLKSENQELKQYLSWQDMELEEMEDLND